MRIVAQVGPRFEFHAGGYKPQSLFARLLGRPKEPVTRFFMLHLGGSWFHENGNRAADRLVYDIALRRWEVTR